MKLTILLLLLIVCAVFLMLWAGTALIQDKKYFTSAPKDVQAAIQPRKERFHGAHALGWVLMIFAMLVIAAALTAAVRDGMQRAYSFLQFFLRFLILLEGYKIWDMIFLDWYLLTKSHFYQHYYPEVSDCESLKHAGFNRKQQLLKLCVLFPLLSLGTAGVCTLMERVVQ